MIVDSPSVVEDNQKEGIVTGCVGRLSWISGVRLVDRQTIGD